MKKSTKLLSVILAIVMIFSSMSVLASAAKANYKTTADLEANAAYSPYGAVTRLSTEERMSILFDYLDNVLGDANINMGKLFDVAGLSLTVDLRSINALLGTIDNVKSLRNNGLVKLVAGLLGILKDLDVSTWQSGMTRESVDQLTIVYELLEFLNQNRSLLAGVIRSGNVDLGVASSALSGVDLSIIGDIPGLIKGLIYPLFQRWDDTTARADQLANTAGNGGMEATLNEFVQRLFTNNMSITTYVEDANGNCVSNHTLPMTEGTRWYFTRGTAEKGDYLQLSSYDTEKKVYVTQEENRYYKTLEEQDAGYDGPDRYVFTKTNADGSKENLKYYKNDSQFLPSFAAAMAAGTASIDLTTDTPAQLFYRFIPYVFAEMAPTVLNGSVKKLFAGLLGAKFTYIGEVGSAEVKALADSSDVFFTQEQGEYLWEWSDYKVINGNHYYRFEDQIYAGDINDVNKYFSLINWDWKVEDNAINEFIPGADGTKSAAGYSTLFQALNDFVAKVIDIAATPELKSMLNWQKGDNSKLVDNIKSAARALLPIEPEIIFGSNYADPDKYYDLIMTANDNQEILVGVACTLLDFLMPQLILPTADTIKGQGVKLGAVLAAVIRELATQFVPTYNYDELIYANYNNKTFVAGKDNAYWLDVCLTMGVDIGMSYLRNLADLGEDDATNGYHFADSKTYKLASFDQTGWEDTVDWIIDWALTDEFEWGWSMIKFVDTYEDIDLATAQDPWVKIGDILNSLLPINILLNVDTSKQDWVKTALRENLVMGILDLDLTKITGATEANGLFNVPMDSALRTEPTLKAVVTVVRNLLNNILSKVAGGELISSSTFTSIDALMNQGNLASFVETLLNKLFTAYNNGMLQPIMPFAGFFIGWKTDPQTFVTPALSLTDTANGGAYLLANGGAVDGTFTIRNDAMGMLLRRAAGVYDSDYIITIKSITASDPNLSIYMEDGSTAFTETAVSPWAKASFRIKGAYASDKPFYLAMTYTLTGKGGKAVGTQYTKYIYAYMDDSTEENVQIASHTDGVQVNNTLVSKVDAVRVQREAFNKVIYASSLQSAIGGLTLTYTNNSGQKYSQWVYSATGNNVPAFAKVNQAYVHGCNENAELKEEKLGWMDGNDDANKTNVLAPLTFNSDVDSSAYVSGTTTGSLGSLDVVWHNHKKGSAGGVKEGGDVKVTIKTPDLGDIYIVDLTSVQEAFEKYDKQSISRDTFPAATDAQWNAFQTAMLNAKRTLSLPYMMDKTVFANEFGVATQEALVKALNDAYNAMAEADASSAATTNVPQTLLDAINETEPEGTTEINYQDYRLYDYFKYQDVRTDVRNRINAYNPPAAPENRIDGSGLSAEEIEAVIASAEGKKALGIRNTVIEPTSEELANYADTLAEWHAPSYSMLDNANTANLLKYYKRFLIKKTTEKQFLAKEIAYANAQNYNEAIYAADSWAAYQSALANAVAVNNDSNALQSTVFDAKYELMKAQNELLRKDRSVKELGLLTELEALVAQAETIFNYSQYYAPKANITEADAYGALIKALGYTYTDKDGNEQILYNRSAAEFLKYDRENTATGLARVAAAEAALKAAIDNFECTVKLVENDGDTTTEVAQGVKIINGITPGSIASIDALMNHVKASAENAVATPTASASGFFGTGAKVDLSIEGIGVLTTYYVVIYGDVNGDGAIDAFDAAVVNQNINTGATLNGVYKDAAMVTSGDDVELADYSAIFNAAVGAQEIDQNRA